MEKQRELDRSLGLVIVVMIGNIIGSSAVLKSSVKIYDEPIFLTSPPFSPVKEGSIDKVTKPLTAISFAYSPEVCSFTA